MNRAELKEETIKLRRKGKTYSEIQRELNTPIPQSTLSYWCKNVELPKEYQEKIKKLVLKNAEKGRAIAVIVNRVRREKFLERLRKKNLYLLKRVDRDVLKMLLAVLHYCEGGKWKGHRGLQLGTSDPELMKFYLNLLKICFPIDKDNLRCRVHYRADQDIMKLQKFWSRITGVPLCHFYKSWVDPRSVGKTTRKKEHKGVCIVKSGSTAIQLELETIAKLLFKGP